MNKELIKECILKYGSPSYIFDLDALKERVLNIKKILGKDINICYAMKANPFIIEEMKDYIDRYEVCSPGEYEICQRHSVKKDVIIVSGVNKTYESMERIMSLCNGDGIFTIESAEHYDILSKVCKEKNIHIRVVIRLTSGNQFGIDKDMFKNILLQLKDNEYLDFAGIHYYSGTQKKLKKVIKEVAMLEEFAEELQDEYGVATDILEYGPGLLFNYFEGEETPSFEEQLSELKDILKDIKSFKHITLEMGRFIASECGYYCTEVVDRKCNNGSEYAIVDGGIHQVNYYGQTLGMKKPFMDVITCNDTYELQKINICGSLCTVNDVILRDVSLPQLDKGDILIFKNCGAYSITEGMALFLSRELPAVIFYNNDTGFVRVRERIGTYLINDGQ
ncbi:diaminopimelate decarboxylase family protein [Eshraghiella crossota]